MLKNDLAMSTKTEYTLTLWLSNSTSKYIANRNDLYKKVHSNTIYNSPKLKTGQLTNQQRKNNSGIFTQPDIHTIWNTAIR